MPRARELSTEAVERRIARALLRLVKAAGRQTGAEVEIAFPTSRENVAQMAGTTLHTVSRVMRAWQAKGLVALGRQRVTVRDPGQLARLAERSES